LAHRDIVLSDGDILATNVLPAYEASLRSGVTAQALHDATGWTEAQIRDRDSVVPGTSTYRHMELMASRGGYFDFVRDALNGHTSSSLGIVGLACKTSETIGDAIQVHGRFQQLTNRSASFVGELRGAQFVFREKRPDSSLGATLISEFALLVAVRLIAEISGNPAPVRQLLVRRGLSPSDRKTLESLANAPVVAGTGVAELQMDSAFLTSRLPQADVEIQRYFESVLGEASARSAGRDTFEDRVRTSIRSRLSEGTPTAAAVAAEFGITLRTLQRRLATSDHQFAALLDEVRADRADELLRRRDLSLTEAAYLLGFAELSSFYRAYRRWFGVPPGVRRVELLGEA
jgi:AraC-like DNA-binding protein